MEIILFLKAIGSLLFTAIFVVTVTLISIFTLAMHLFKTLAPTIPFRKDLIFRRKNLQK